MYWIGWAVILIVVIVSLAVTGWYLGAKLDAIVEVLRGR
jgi:hypothetical protein